MLSQRTINKALEYIENDTVEELDWVDRGLFKDVYWVPGKRAVIKVMRDSDRVRFTRSFEFEWACYVVADRRNEAVYFPDTLWVETETYGLVMIQEAVRIGAQLGDDERYQEILSVTTWGRNFGLHDLHPANVGYTKYGNKRAVIIDWGYDVCHKPDSVAEKTFEAVETGSALPNEEELAA